METIDAIQNRRSIRKYKDDEVSKELIEDILNCGRLVPSAKNRQPWYFVVTNVSLKDKIADLMIKYTNKDNIGSIRNTANIIKEAPYLILIFRNREDWWDIGDNLSIGACIQNMCLRAVELNLGSLWIRDTYCVEDKIAELVNEDRKLVCALSIGYANSNSKGANKKNLEEIIKWMIE